MTNSGKDGKFIENEQMFAHRVLLEMRCIMPDINLLWWLTLILLTAVVAALLASQKKAEEAAARKLQQLADASFRQPAACGCLSADSGAAGSLQPACLRPQPPPAFFQIPDSQEQDGRTARLQLQYELPRRAELSAQPRKKAAVADCHYCA